MQQIQAVSAACCFSPRSRLAWWSVGNRELAAVILDEAGAAHSSSYNAGRILGYLAIVLWVLSLILLLGGLLEG